MKDLVLTALVIAGIFMGYPEGMLEAAPEDPASVSAKETLWKEAARAEQTLKESGRLYQDGKLTPYLHGLLRKLRPDGGYGGLTFETLIIKDPHVNAYAYPNGLICVQTGILARIDNEAQLAFLLAHEMVHCGRRHSLRALHRSRENIPASMEGPSRGGPGFSASPATDDYRQELEVEADLEGLALVIRAGYNPQEALGLFHILMEARQRRGTRSGDDSDGPAHLEKRSLACRRFLAQERSGITEQVPSNKALHGHFGRVILENVALEIQNGRWGCAQEQLERYFRIKPGEARAFYLLGEVFRLRGAEGDFERAQRAYRKAVSLDPNYPDPYQRMGLMHFTRGNLQAAKPYFERCLALSPQRSDTAYIRGYIKKCVN